MLGAYSLLAIIHDKVLPECPAIAKGILPEELAGHSWQQELFNLPPPVRDRLTRIMTEHAESILIEDRFSLRQERRGDGRPYWRLYLESGSGEERERRRVYVGPEGGPELRAAIIRFRRACWDGCDGPMQFIRAANTTTLRRLKED